MKWEYNSDSNTWTTESRGGTVMVSMNRLRRWYVAATIPLPRDRTTFEDTESAKRWAEQWIAELQQRDLRDREMTESNVTAAAKRLLELRGVPETEWRQTIPVEHEWISHLERAEREITDHVLVAQAIREATGKS